MLREAGRAGVLTLAAGGEATSSKREGVWGGEGSNQLELHAVAPKVLPAQGRITKVPGCTRDAGISATPGMQQSRPPMAENNLAAWLGYNPNEGEGGRWGG